MIEIDVDKDKAQYQAELDLLTLGLANLQAQLAQQMRAIDEHRGILIYLNSKNQQKALE